MLRVLLILCALASATAVAGEPAALFVDAGKDVPKKLAASVEVALRDHLATAYSLPVMEAQQVEKVLADEKKSAAECASDTLCLERWAAALGATHLVFARVQTGAKKQFQGSIIMWSRGTLTDEAPVAAVAQADLADSLLFALDGAFADLQAKSTPLSDGSLVDDSAAPGTAVEPTAAEKAAAGMPERTDAPQATTEAIVMPTRDAKIDWTVAFMTRAAVVEGGVGVLLGARAGLLAADALSVAAAGYFSVLDPVIAAPDSRRRYLDMGYGGLEVGFAASPMHAIHGGVHMLAAIGAMGHHSNNPDDAYVGLAPVGVAEPGAELMVNLTNSISVGARAGYRFVFGADDLGLVVTQETPDPRDRHEVNLANGVNLDLMVQLTL